MYFRLAAIKDLPQLKSRYMELVKSMDEHQIQIWDDAYPCDLFEDDIKHNRLYLMLENTKLFPHLFYVIPILARTTLIRKIVVPKHDTLTG